MRRIPPIFLLVLDACASAVDPLPRERVFLPDLNSGEPVRLDLDLVRRVDLLIQERFATVTGEDIKLSRFGFSRISPKRSHPWDFVPESEAERELVRRVSESGWRAAIFTIGNWHGFPPVAHGPVAFGGDSWGLRDGTPTATRLGKDCMKAGVPQQGQEGRIAFEARPVFASKSICLRCHDNRKAGDVLGAVITAFEAKRAPVPTSGE